MGQMEFSQLMARGETLFESGNLEEAESCFQAILDAKPQNAEVLNNLGVIAYQRRDFQKAISQFQRAVALDKHCLSAAENLAETLILAGEFVRAAEIIRDARKAGLASPSLLQTAAQCFLGSGDPFSARKALNESVHSRANAPLDQAPVHSGASGRPRVGFLTIWFERGQSYVTRMLRDALTGGFDTYVFARMGMVFGETKQETKGNWSVPNLTTYHDYSVPAHVFKEWIVEKKIDAVIFNEEYDWKLVEAAKQTGTKVITYLDYYKHCWEPQMKLFDAVLCSTLRTFYLVRGVCRAEYVGWAVDTDLFAPKKKNIEKHTFFHNAGWLGINYRKMTPAVIVAFDAISKNLPDISLFVHAQAGLDKLPPPIVDIIRANRRIHYHIETTAAPGLYHRGKVLLFPTKLEGLGLPLLEGLASGLPAIATNAAPMNEFVKDGYNGRLIKVARSVPREDAVAFPETLVDLNDLALKMAQIAADPAYCGEMAANARKYAERELNPQHFSTVLSRVLHRLLDNNPIAL